MARYDGLIIPRSYSEYINKTDSATLQQALQQSGVLDSAPTEDSVKAVKSGGVYTALQGLETEIGGKQDALTFDDEPTVGSNNPVKSSGLVPVDEVTSDNMHAVTSNAVADSKSYTTTEQLTGGKWIDGKPIYRKAGHLDSVSSGNVVLDPSLTPSVVDVIINAGGCVIDPSGTILGGMAYSSADYRLALGCNSSGLYKLDVYSGTYTNFNWWVEYTKK